MPPADPDPLWEELQAELADHLASAAESNQRKGEPPGAATAAALAAFGDPAKIARACWWIKRRNEVMKNAALLCGIGLLAVAALFTSVQSWTAQRATASKLEAVSDRLGALVDLQQKTLVASEGRPVEISGSLYLDSPDRPAANFAVQATGKLNSSGFGDGSAPGPQFFARTDAKGRFTLKVPSKQNYFLQIGQRAVDGWDGLLPSRGPGMISATANVQIDIGFIAPGDAIQLTGSALACVIRMNDQSYAGLQKVLKSLSPGEFSISWKGLGISSPAPAPYDVTLESDGKQRRQELSVDLGGWHGFDVYCAEPGVQELRCLVPAGCYVIEAAINRNQGDASRVILTSERIQLAPGDEVSLEAVPGSNWAEEWRAAQMAGKASELILKGKLKLTKRPAPASAFNVAFGASR
ncbi:MAG TPA: permease prefix domain 1-containing protein [Planctomycetia bacterium]|nr:permease prefix domain 1-containing protein [Planctomycetia bacterium]